MLVAWLAAVGGAGARPRWTPALTGTIVAVCFGYANFVLTGYYKDISADRATGYRTLPVVFGTTVAARVSDAFAVIQVAGLLLAWIAIAAVARSAALVSGTALLLAGIAAVVLGQRRLRHVTEATAHAAIAPVVHGYILALAGIAAAARPWWTPALLACYAGWLVALRRRPMPEQI
jgi:4-hydroxybenzoate polyprenyltransferase